MNHWNEGDFHKFLMDYAVTCEREGSLSDRAVTTRMNIATCYNELMDYSKRSALEARIDELNAIYGWSHDDRSPLIHHPEHRSTDYAQMAANGMGTNFTVRERLRELREQVTTQTSKEHVNS